MHLDGDRRYTDKSSLYYKKAGLQAIVKYIPEYRQPSVIKNLLKKYMRQWAKESQKSVCTVMANSESIDWWNRDVMKK